MATNSLQAALQVERQLNSVIPPQQVSYTQGSLSESYFDELAKNSNWLSLVDILATKDVNLTKETAEHGRNIFKLFEKTVLEDTEAKPEYRRGILEGLQSITPRGGSSLTENLLLQESREICNMDPSSLIRSVSTFLSSVHSSYVPKEIRHTLIPKYTLRLHCFKDVSECEEALVALEEEMARPCNQI